MYRFQKSLWYCKQRFSIVHYILLWFWSISAMDLCILQQYLKLYCKQWFFYLALCSWKGSETRWHHSAYLFIIVLEILCIFMHNSKDICGIKVDSEELRLSLFADDLTGFWKTIFHLETFLTLWKITEVVRAWRLTTKNQK